MKKYAIFLLLLLAACVTLSELEKAATEDRVPASYGKYRIDIVSNEATLQRRYPDLEHSDCGLADEEFIKYARERIDHRRKFQFIVFISGNAITGKRCLRSAIIFYLRQK